MENLPNRTFIRGWIVDRCRVRKFKGDLVEVRWRLVAVHGEQGGGGNWHREIGRHANLYGVSKLLRDMGFQGRDHNRRIIR